MNALSLVKILLLSFAFAIAGRYAALSAYAWKQNVLTQDLCRLVSLPLETGLLRDTHEGLENALKARGETGACVSVTDHGRSFSPDCTRSGTTYRMVMCRAEGNTGTRATIYFEQRGLLEAGLVYLWVLLSLLSFAFIALLNFGAKYLVQIYSAEVSGILGVSEASLNPSWLSRFAAWSMKSVGISDRLAEQAAIFRRELRDFEEKIQLESLTRARVEEEAGSSKRYIEKVKQIRHDIRSPLSSLQAVYEKLKADSTMTTAALAAAIRRIQVLVDDLGEIERQGEVKLVVAEVVAEDVALVMTGKFREAKSAELSLEYSREELSPVLAEEKGLQGIIENLLENALDAISVGGRVNLKISKTAGHCQISVEDDGCGIPADVLPKLFTPRGTFGKVNGQGLGLYHAKKCVEAWGGTVLSVPRERGACFVVSLPLMQTGVVFSGLPGDPRIKVIDDDKLVPDALAKAGFDVLAAASSYAEGKKLFEIGTDDGSSILVDQQLDHGHLGTSLIAEQPWRKKVFLCTNDFDDLAVVKLAREIGVKIIPKPLCFVGQHKAALDS